MADTIIGAVVQKFDQSTAYGQVTASGGLWLGEVPAEKEYPIAVLWHLGEVPELNTGGTYVERGKLQFETYATTLEAAESIATLIKDDFDPYQDSSGNTYYVDVSLPSGVTLMRFERSNYLVTSGETQAPDSKTVYQTITEYEYEVVRPMKVKS